MTWQAAATLLVVAATIVSLARELLPPSATMLSATVALLVTGVVTPEQAFSGFSNPAPITVAALYVLAGAVEKTGALQPAVSGALGDGNQSRWTLARLLIPTAGASAFLNNTPIVAMLVPQVSNWADRRGLSPSRFLMPLSFAAILGGMITVIGTSTNLVVSGLLESSDAPPLTMFELTPVALPLAVLGLGLILALAPRALPERRAARRDLDEEAAREFVVNMVVVPDGPLDGQAVEAGGLRHLEGVFLAEIERSGEVIAPVAPTTILHGGDRLTFVGRADLVVDLHATRGLVSSEEQHLADLDSPSHTFFEAVIGATSPLVGKTLKEAEFRRQYQSAVVAIHRAGQRVRAKLGEVRLRVGDTLLLLSDWGFEERWHDRSDFLLVSRLGGPAPAVTQKAGLVALVALAIVALAAAGVLPILHAALIGAIALVLLRVLTPAQARNVVDLDVVVLIAAAFGLAAAIESSGLADLLAGGLVQTFGPLGPRGALLGTVLATLALTELVTNNAAVVLVFPIALATAAQLGLDPRPFTIAIALAASSSFLTPIGYQTNTMVYGPGGYRFTDYIRLGLPLTLLVVSSIVLLVPFFWALR